KPLLQLSFSRYGQALSRHAGSHSALLAGDVQAMFDAVPSACQRALRCGPQIGLRKRPWAANPGRPFRLSTRLDAGHRDLQGLPAREKAVGGWQNSAPPRFRGTKRYGIMSPPVILPASRPRI